MKKNYNLTMKTGKIRMTWFVLVIILAMWNNTAAQITTYTFTHCGAIGQNGPTQAQANSAYALTNLNGSVQVTGGIQTFTIPTSGLYRIVAAGSAGGGIINNFGCRGRIVQGEINLTAGQILKILVGQKGYTDYTSTGGGGGSYVATITNTPLVIGAGGAGYNTPLGSSVATTDGQYGTSGQTSTDGGGTGGTNGNGGNGHNSQWGGGGGGWLTNGSQGQACAGTGGLCFLNGGTGGSSCYSSLGGFGGGGGTHGNTGGGGGGGGYSGGGGSGQTPNTSAGGGGGSYQAPGMTNLLDLGFNTGNGYVLITRLCYFNLNVSSNPICAGNSVTLTTDAVSNYSWSTGSTAPSIVVSPAVNTSYSLVATSSLNCVASAVVNITVSPGLPVLSVNSSTNDLCLGKSATLTASGALTYTWSNNVTNGVAFTPSVTNTYTVTGENGCGTTSAVTTISVSPLAVTAQNTPSLVCAGLPSTLSATAAATGFTWQPFGLVGAVVLTNPTVNTVYTVIASDGTCSGTATLSLNPLPVPTIGVVSSTSVTCAGSPVMMSANGGLTYTWMPGNLSGPSVTVHPTGPTLYTVSGSNSFGCATSTTQIVVTDPSPTVNVTASSTLVCSGATVDLLASGNAAGYSWTNGPFTPGYQVFPNTNMVYTVTGSSSTNTCTTTKTIAVYVFSPTVSVISDKNTICEGESVMLTASGGDDYNWSNGSAGSQITVSPPVTTTYSVSATSSSLNLTCNVQSTIQITVNPNPTVTATSSRTLICKNENTSLFGSGAQNYVWSTGAQSSSVTVAPTVITIHTYTLTGTDVNGCSNNTTIQIRVVPCSGLSEQQTGKIAWIAYPNPSDGTFTIESDTGLSLEIRNILGQLMRTVECDQLNGFKVQLTGFEPGIYFLQAKGKAQSSRIVVE